MHDANKSVVSTPILAVSDMATSEEFYRRLGLHIDRFNPRYSIVSLTGVELFHLEANTGRGPAAVYLNVQDADEWHERSSAAGLTVGAIANKTWVMREFAIIDPSGNALRIGHNL